MKVTLGTAYSTLDVPYGASESKVVERVKELLLRTSDTKFTKSVCAAYLRISTIGCSDEVYVDTDTVADIRARLLDSGCSDEFDTSDEDSRGDFDEKAYKEAQIKRSEEFGDQLISEEEREKRKAEKKRQRKKKRKEKKRLEKESEQKNMTNGSGDARHDQNGVRSSDEGEGIDLNAAFVLKSKRKLPEHHNQTANRSDNKKETVASTTGSQQTENDADKAVIAIAIKGNQMAQDGDYPAAIKLFSEAIKLKPIDYRFFGNRSYCYDRIMQYEKARVDADKCIELSPDWPKAYFRKGRALAGLKEYSDAEKAFLQVLKLDKNCEEATKELVRVRTQQLIDMGFSDKEAEGAALRASSVQQAIDIALAIHVPDLSMSADGDDIYVSDEEEFSGSVHSAMNGAAQPKIKARLPHTEEKKMDPTNPQGSMSLWVGNVLPTVTESDLQKLFGRYGHVTNVRCLPDRYCAFVNFTSKEMAGKAMNALQNHEVEGQNLLIKYPDNPIAQNGAPVTRSRAFDSIQHKKPAHKVGPMAAAVRPKTTGPVNGDECYFWRTTGCQFGDKCRHKHIKENRGIDRQPWQRTKP